MASIKGKNSKINISAKDVLEFLAMGGVLLAAIVAPNAVQGFRFLFKKGDYTPWKDFKQYRVRQIVNRLQKQDLVKRKIKNSRGCYFLTDKGKRLIVKYNLEKLQLRKQRKWDHKWRVVLFDIPEYKKAARDALHSKLKHLGMHQIQKSVFIYPFECKREIDFVSDFFGVGEDILYMEADIQDVEKELKHGFNL